MDLLPPKEIITGRLVSSILVHTSKRFNGMRLAKVNNLFLFPLISIGKTSVIQLYHNLIVSIVVIYRTVSTPFPIFY